MKGKRNLWGERDHKQESGDEGSMNTSDRRVIKEDNSSISKSRRPLRRPRSHARLEEGVGDE